jgi:hypothetical protein
LTLSAKNLDNRLVEFVGPTTMKSVHLYFIQNYITSKDQAAVLIDG